MESEIIIELTKKLSDDDIEVRREARWDLIEKGEKAVKPLIYQLNSDDIQVIKESAWVLGKVEDPRAIKPLTELLGDESASVRKKAGIALVKIGKGALPVVLDQLKSDDVIRRRTALWFLPDFEEDNIGIHLFHALEDSDPMVRKNATRAIGLLNIGGAITYLSKVLNDKDWRVRQWAAFSMGLISKKKGVTRGLLRVINDSSSHVQYAAVVALGDNKSKSALRRLFKLLKKSDDKILRIAIIKSLGNIGSRKAVRPLIDIYWSGDVYTRGEVVVALGRIGGVGDIYNVLEDALLDEKICDLAVYALYHLGTNKAKKLLNMNRNR